MELLIEQVQTWIKYLDTILYFGIVSICLKWNKT